MSAQRVLPELTSRRPAVTDSLQMIRSRECHTDECIPDGAGRPDQSPFRIILSAGELVDLGVAMTGPTQTV